MHDPTDGMMRNASMQTNNEMDKWVARYRGLKLAGRLSQVAAESPVGLATGLQLQLLKQPSSWLDQEPMTMQNYDLSMQS